ncbi:MAG: hypothetical protein JRJ59_12715, partial [Deltaproteobacteria bacterium]|nr:hypothetical protein [Deltaproteobacteria bacterium]
MTLLRQWMWLPLMAGLLVLAAGPGLAAETGQVTVNLGPAQAVAAGAAWSLDQGRTWHESGQTVELEAGTYVIHFRLISGWRQPQALQLNLPAGARAEVEKTYLRLPAKLRVDLGPAQAVAAGAAWSLDEGRTWHDSGQTVEVEAGAYLIQFKAVPGWRQPLVYPLDLSLQDTARVNATYGRLAQGGQLRVDLGPAQAVDLGAAWSLDEGRTWH